MNGTRLRNVYLWKRSDENREKYSSQRNYGVSLLRRTKRKCSLDEKSITDNKFRMTVKPFLSEKCPSNAKIILIEDDEVMSSDIETACVLNNLDFPEKKLEILF